MLMYGRNQHSIVIILSFKINFKNKTIKVSDNASVNATSLSNAINTEGTFPKKGT